ncbi:MAG: hypothetical protein CM15mP117_16260 [Alphaproteobacteria bacterium]|nr:MAG: hypothetical protein CM15mP117_16260 [Alphaproteobacteria bacterium]
MLLVGLSLQIIGLIFLSLLDPSFDYILSIIWVLAAQGISGLAKDFTKRLQNLRSRVWKLTEGKVFFTGFPGSPDPKMQ